MASLQSSASSSSPMHRFSKKRGANIMSILDLRKSFTTTTSTISLHDLQAGELPRNFTSFIDKSPANYDQMVGSERSSKSAAYPLVMEKLYAILESIADRVEMHQNIGQQRENWNSLLLTSINSITLAASTISAIAISSSSTIPEVPALSALNLSSTFMFLAATGMLVIMNKIQPSQLVEEQRNAARLFKQLYNQIQTKVTIGKPTQTDVNDAMDKILALDKAYPLPLLGVMLEKFPSQIEPAVWWPQQNMQSSTDNSTNQQQSAENGWNSKLESEMKAVVEVVRRKDKEEYLRLGGKALKLNRMLAVSGPVLTGIAAISSAISSCNGSSSLASIMAATVCGGLASMVNAMEHGGQVGMVFEMYRSNAGFFKLVEYSIESELMKAYETRENGELFEMKMALQLGRSLSELRDLASKSSSSFRGDDHHHQVVEEFASKLF
ncbi:OLC1v1027891C1 [Oldenlandia corymbosa var. corymbosa]|uniref:OLC1v1027891C1 n=1 Tax=Oldenlandia corymbosa var. corymbosa TaxID=529605 RepID=A0AAV1CD76_OLDCO|nr:OLC1v1027891C1 [Oldenlandia corymbosa var. corymbosa]